MHTVARLRFHGRGGEGVRLASRIVGRALFLAGFNVQDSPLYGAERRGAPVVAFVRASQGPIQERGYVTSPDVVVVMDDSLLGVPEAAVLEGVTATTLVLVNSSRDADTLQRGHHAPGACLTCDISSLALETLGQHRLSAPTAGFTIKATGLCTWPVLVEAVRRELADAGLDEAEIARNLEATEKAFRSTPSLGIGFRTPGAVTEPHAPFVVPRLPAWAAAPTIVAEANSALRTTAGWRVYRPVIDLSRCSRCFLCFVLCPEGAVHLDAEHDPWIDYDHCKGCLVCVEECPPHAIASVREGAV
jgi:pyruvate ferredoxin oxidoreductase gamma subunit